MKQKIAFYLILLFYFVIGLYYSNIQGFWLDEIYTLTFLKGISAYNFNGATLFNIKQVFSTSFYKALLNNDNFLNNFHIQIIHEGHPPLYYLFLKSWTLIFGLSEIALRGFSLFCGMLSFVILFGLLKERFKKKPYVYWFLLFLLISNPFLFYYFTEARMYALTFLFATLSFYFYVKFKKNESLNFSNFVFFCLCSAALLYTHYYGLFFLLTIVFYELIKYGYSLRKIKYFIPIILFLPWIFIIKLQTKLYTHHWTDGSFSFIKSTLAFNKKTIELFFLNPINNEVAITLFSILAGLLILFFVSKSIKNRIIYFLLALFYFLEIFTFDTLQNHHTINVPRYFIIILIFFYWAIAKSIENAPKLLLVIFGLVYLFFTGTIYYNLITLSFGKKQMNKEVAVYLDTKPNPQKTIIVVEPGGAIIWGLAYYLKKDFFITSAENFNSLNENELKLYNKVIFIDNMVGYHYRKKHFNLNEKSKLKRVDFVGLSLYE